MRVQGIFYEVRTVIKGNLFAHQQGSLQFCLVNDRVFDMSDAGTGKTLVQIARHAEHGFGKQLVIAPKSLLTSAWRNDYCKFAPHMRVSVAQESNREKAFKADADVYVTNTDATTWLAKQKASFFDGFSSLVVDESEAFKHHTSARSKALLKIVDYFQYRALLSATPASVNITELWHQMFLLDGGKRLGDNFHRFRYMTCDAIPKLVGVTWIEKPNIRLLVAELLKDCTIRHVFEECVDIPPNHSYVVSYKPSIAQEQAYRQMRSTQFALLQNVVISAANGGAVATKLRQIASGAVYGDDGASHIIDYGRYELIADLVESVSHSVVFFLWKHQRLALEQVLARRNLSFGVIDGSVAAASRDKSVDMFQKGALRCMLIHPQSGAHGLTLTKGVRTIWASPVYTANTIEQGRRRIYRLGQTQKTETIFVVAEGTIDEVVYDIATTRSADQQTLLSLLSAYYKEIADVWANTQWETGISTEDFCLLESS